MNVDLDAYNHPSWFSAVGTAAGYLLLLTVMTIVLFGIPTLLFLAVG